MRERGARWRLLRVLSEYSLSLTVTQTIVDPRGEPAVLCSGTSLGTGVPPWCPPPNTRPRRAQRWHDRAALGGEARQSPNRPIARRIRRRRERPGQLRVRRLRLLRIGGVRRPSRRRRRPCRGTPLHYAARNGHSSSVAELLLRGADGAVQNNDGYRCAAPHSRNRNPQAAARAQAHAEAMGGKLWEARAIRGGGEPGALRPPPHRPPPPSPPTLLVPTDVSSVLAVGARRASWQGGDAALAL